MIGTRPHPERISCGVLRNPTRSNLPEKAKPPDLRVNPGASQTTRSHVVVELEPLPLS
jgi:hypothetical protein